MIEASRTLSARGPIVTADHRRATDEVKTVAQPAFVFTTERRRQGLRQRPDEPRFGHHRLQPITERVSGFGESRRQYRD